VGPRAVQDAVVKIKIPSSRRESKPRTSIVQSVVQLFRIQYLENQYFEKIHLVFSTKSVPMFLVVVVVIVMVVVVMMIIRLLFVNFTFCGPQTKGSLALWHFERKRLYVSGPGCYELKQYKM
jgi:hypothetical protein